MKSTVEQIRARFDRDVERFSNLETGQSAVVDAPLCLELVTQAAAAVTPRARDLLDIGCGAGNYTLKMIEALGAAGKMLHCTLMDLSRPMLDRAAERVRPQTAGRVTALEGDMRELALGEGAFDIVLAAATLHHLRTDAEWEAMFAKVYRALRPGGSFWSSDLIEHGMPAVEKLMMRRYGAYLVGLKGGGAEGEAYRDHVFAYIAEEDTPKPLVYQLDLLRKVGFANVDVLHKSVVGAAFGAVKLQGETATR